jgi:hypothetical protein
MLVRDANIGIEKVFWVINFQFVFSSFLIKNIIYVKKGMQDIKNLHIASLGKKGSIKKEGTSRSI